MLMVSRSCQSTIGMMLKWTKLNKKQLTCQRTEESVAHERKDFGCPGAVPGGVNVVALKTVNIGAAEEADTDARTAHKVTTADLIAKNPL